MEAIEIQQMKDKEFSPVVEPDLVQTPLEQPVVKKSFGGLFGKTMNQIKNVIDDLSE
jgi:hypothetical protein